ncbi:MAG: hypothetical protein GEU75_08130 [Dehalococcoidia bacterium]|nr:hypothetical protein [Dehalococcoidia bacterium]
MIAEAGFRITRKQMDTQLDYPKFRDGNGQFENWAYIVGGPLASEPVAAFVWRHTKTGGAGFLGYDAAGKGDQSGDPEVISMIARAGRETDVNRRKAIVQDIQRYLGKAQYQVMVPGGFSRFDLAWPGLKNFQVYNGDQRGPNHTWWHDRTLPPFNRA